MIAIRRRPFFYLAGCFSLGIWLGSINKHPDKTAIIIYSIICVLAFLLICVLRKNKLISYLLLFSFALLGVISSETVNNRHQATESAYVSLDSRPVTVEGIVSSNPLFNSEKGYFQFYFTIRRILYTEKQETVRLTVYTRMYSDKDLGTLSRGKLLRVRGILRKPDLPEDRSQFDFRNYLYTRGVFFVLTVPSSKNVTVLGTRELSLFNRLAQVLRERISVALTRGVKTDTVEFSILQAMILGDRMGMPRNLQRKFMETNTMHILAISGLHVGIVALCIISIARLLFIKKQVSYIIAVAFLMLYVVIAGGRPSVTRAVIMIGSVLLGKCMQKDVDILNSLGLSALIILFVRPFALFDPGFQLSFLTLLSIIVLVPVCGDLFKIEEQKRLVRKAFLTISVACAAWLGSFPLTVYYFHLFSPYSVIVNIVAVMYLYVIIFCEIVSIFIGQVFSPIAEYINVFVEFLVSGLLEFITFVSKIPGSWFNAGFEGAQSVIACYALFSLALFMMRKGKRYAVAILFLPILLLFMQ